MSASCARGVIAPQTLFAKRKETMNNELLKQTLDLVSSSAFDIRGLGKKRVEALILAGVISKPFDILSITNDQLIEHVKIADSLAKTLTKRIALSKDLSMFRFLKMVGGTYVPVGEYRAALSKYRNIDEFYSDPFVLPTYSNIAMGEKILNTLSSKYARNLYEELLRHGVKVINFSYQVDPRKLPLVIRDQLIPLDIELELTRMSNRNEIRLESAPQLVDNSTTLICSPTNKTLLGLGSFFRSKLVPFENFYDWANEIKVSKLS